MTPKQYISSKIITIKFNRRYAIFVAVLILTAFAIIIFTSHNEFLYKRPIAKVILIEEKTSENTDVFGFSEKIYLQKIEAKIMNGNRKGEKISFENSASYSQVINSRLQKNDEVFLIIKENSQGEMISITISDLKRDKYIAFVAVFFVVALILIGKKKGVLSLLSLVFNIALVFVIIELYLKGINIVLLSVFATFIFVAVTIFLVGGVKKSSVSAIISTLLGTAFSMAIAIFVMFISKSKGVFYEEMEFITANPTQIFLAGILIGNLGGIMDIAVSLSTSIREMYEVDAKIEHKIIVKSAKNIGGDIMGTMSNTLLFAYISGSLPMILLLLKNGFSPFYIIHNNISLNSGVDGQHRYGFEHPNFVACCGVFS